MKLLALPKAFNLPSVYKKGYFPYLFNTIENENYIGPLPFIEFYSPGSMKGTDFEDKNDERKEFLKCYENHKSNTFDMNKKLTEYCVSDVNILTHACVKFRNDFIIRQFLDCR